MVAREGNGLGASLPLRVTGRGGRKPSPPSYPQVRAHYPQPVDNSQGAYHTPDKNLYIFKLSIFLSKLSYSELSPSFSSIVFSESVTKLPEKAGEGPMIAPFA